MAIATAPSWLLRLHDCRLWLCYHTPLYMPLVPPVRLPALHGELDARNDCTILQTSYAGDGVCCRSIANSSLDDTLELKKGPFKPVKSDDGRDWKK